MVKYKNYKKATIIEAFSRYYRTTLLSDETDPNKLYDLIAVMEEYQVFTQDHVEKLVNNLAALLFRAGNKLWRWSPPKLKEGTVTEEVSIVSPNPRLVLARCVLKKWIALKNNWQCNHASTV